MAAKDQMEEISRRLEEGVKKMFTSERYTEYLKTLSKFHQYSFNNTLLIAMQRPDATLVAGYKAWQTKFNRQVRRGEKGIQIVAPFPVKKVCEYEKTDPDTGKRVLDEKGNPVKERKEETIPRYRTTYVFDISQTDGEPIPELRTPELYGSVENYERFLGAVREISPVPVRFDQVPGEAKGYYNQKEIVLQEGMSELQTMKTALHELSHAILHDWEKKKKEHTVKDQMTKEVEAESVAYAVTQYFGLDTSEYSFFYIAGWSSDQDMKELRASMDLIRETAGSLIGSLADKLELLKEKSMDRYQVEPAKESQAYTVWDKEGNCPAAFGKTELTFQDYREAEEIAAYLNAGKRSVESMSSSFQELMRQSDGQAEYQIPAGEMPAAYRQLLMEECTVSGLPGMERLIRFDIPGYDVVIRGNDLQEYFREGRMRIKDRKQGQQAHDKEQQPAVPRL